jgi:capsular exopolysaccharide synthesis family protein
MIPARPEPDFDQGNEQSVDFRQLYHIFLERAWAVVLVLVVTVFLGALYVIRSPKAYSSSLTFQVEQEERRALSFDKFSAEALGTSEILKTFEQTVISRPILERVAATNNLVSDKAFLSIYEKRKGLFDTLVETSKANEDAITPSQIVDTLAAITESRLRRGTRLVDITVEHPVPRTAAALANSIYKEFISSSYEQYVQTSLGANQFLLEEAEKLKKKLRASEQALNDYREKAKTVSIDDKLDTAVQGLKDLKMKAVEAKSLRIRLENDWEQVKRMNNDVTALLGIQSVANDAAVQSVRVQLSKEDSEFATLRQRYLPKHPKYMQALSRLAEWRTALTNAIAAIPSRIEAAYNSARSSEQSLESALKEAEEKALSANKQSIELGVLQREADTDRVLYDAVLKRLKEAQVTKELQSDKLRLVQPAIVPVVPVKPQKVKIMAAAVLVGLMGGVMLALLLNQIDSSIKTIDQAEEYLGLPVLTAIPQITSFVGKRGLVVVDDAKSIGAEAIRTLRTSLSMLGRAEDRRVFLFTSAIPAEGKTFCSINYAVSLAQQGLKTLLIDGDLRRPAVEKAIAGRDKKAVGVTDYILGQKSLKDVVQPTDIENFSFVPAGTTAPNPAELLGKHGVDGLIAEALLHYDKVVIDSAPVHAVSDTLLMLQKVQTLCLVARANRTPRKATLRAVQMLKQPGTSLAGLILNRLPRRVGLSGYYYDSYYNYSYYGKYSTKGVYGAKK